MSYQDVPYSTRSKIYNFLEKEFLNADNATFRLIAKHYYKYYGSGAGDYLMKTYYSWQKGWTGISSLTFGRIIECMPKYLSDEKRFYILKEETHSFFEKKKNEFKNQDLSLSEINESFASIQKSMLAFGKEDLQWFIGNNIFSEEQVEHYLKICRHVLNEKIIQAHTQVANDLELIKQKLSNFTGIINGASYNIEFFRKKIYVEKIKSIGFTFKPLELINFQIDESFKKFGEHYFLDELMKISFAEKKNQANTILKSNDIDIFFSHFLELKKQTVNQISMNSTYEGEGGTLSIDLEFVPYSVSKRLIYTASLKLLSFTSLSVLLVLVITMFLNYWIILSIIAVIVWFNFLYPEVKKEISNIQLATNQMKIYGQQ